MQWCDESREEGRSIMMMIILSPLTVSLHHTVLHVCKCCRRVEIYANKFCPQQICTFFARAGGNVAAARELRYTVVNLQRKWFLCGDKATLIMMDLERVRSRRTCPMAVLIRYNWTTGNAAMCGVPLRLRVNVGNRGLFLSKPPKASFFRTFFRPY